MNDLATLPRLPAIVTGHVAHRRHAPIVHALRHRIHLWLVDLDDLPRLPWWLRPLASFSARDHLGGRRDSASDGADDGATGDLRANLDRFLATRGVRLGEGGRVVLLAGARVLGYVFDPISVYWCFTADGRLRCVVAEVHNTWGERHAYLVEPDADGRARVDKELHVSPYNDASGHYELRFRLDPTRVTVEATLHREGHRVLDASFDGVPAPATRRAIVAASLRRPGMPQRVAALIRMHGVWLWLRRLPIVPRRPHRPQEGV